MDRIDTAGVQRLIERGAQIIEVLPPADYEREHLPGACNIPLGSMQPSAVADLVVNCPTVTYCFDHQCDLSARAARRLETLGFTEVYDYVASKAGWLACGLPAEGTIPDSARAGSIARRDVPRCALGETLGNVRAQFEVADLVVVVDDDHRDDGTLIGVIERADLHGHH